MIFQVCANSISCIAGSPFIARFSDGGSTAVGLLFFVTECVEGKNIREFYEKSGAIPRAKNSLVPEEIKKMNQAISKTEK